MGKSENCYERKMYERKTSNIINFKHTYTCCTGFFARRFGGSLQFGNMQFSNTHALVDFTSHQSLFSLSFVCFSSHRASSSSFTPRSRSIPKKTSISFLFLILPYIMCVSIFYFCPSSLHVPLSYPFFLSTVLPLLLF